MPWFRMTPRSAAYVTTATWCATLGFIDGTTWPILLAAAISLPASIVTLPGYYVLYGLLATVPGADPSSSSGSGSVDTGGHLLSSVTTGTPAVWFTITTLVLGILALAVGAFANVQLTRVLAARRRRRVADTRL